VLRIDREHHLADGHRFHHRAREHVSLRGSREGLQALVAVAQRSVQLRRATRPVRLVGIDRLEFRELFEGLPRLASLSERERFCSEALDFTNGGSQE
jgi:hypothetical protein